MQEGIIIKGIGGFYYIKTKTGEISECKARGVFRKKRITPMVGDRVVIDKGSIIDIKPRENFMIRPPVANIDLLLIVVAAASPDPNLFLIDKLLVYAESLKIDACICINKTDLKDDSELSEIYKKAGYRVISVSAEKETNIDELKDLLKGRITAFCGLSGVGKSSLLNLVSLMDMETGNLSEKIMRGKHTTRHVELTELESGGYVFDTPGFSSIELTDITDMEAENLSECFPEFLKDECRFKTCVHINEPDCVVKKMVEDGEISESRYENYSQMYEILKNRKVWK